MPTSICIVHSHLPTLVAIRDILLSLGHDDVTTFENPTKALDAIEGSGRFCLLITAVNFGRGRQTGVSLARMLRFKNKTIRILFIDDEGFREVVRDIGDFLSTPLDVTGLTSRVRLLTNF